MIDIGVEYITSQLTTNKNSNDKNKILLGTLDFSCMISAANTKNVHQSPSTSLIKSYEDCLLNGQKTTLIGLAFVQLSHTANAIGHWIAYKVDFNKHEISYGN